ncbi:histidine--tRNA ligase [Candidatus Woesebacteria bacterium]|nr:histidine--tRNA ligase [Candidatus Woesebacteria bacterium]
MSSSPQTLRGFRDFLPEAAQKRQWLKNKIINIFESWGYDPLETPTLESLDLFKGKIGADENLFFQFQDPGGREVALRYDQTVPACRVVGQYAQQLPMPFKRYQIQSAFRAEKPQKGRYREFLQCDADIFGTTSPLADAECIALSLEVYRQLGFKEAKVLISDRSLLAQMPYEAIVAIDKIKKIGAEGVIAEMSAKGIDTTTARSYLKYIEELQPNESITTILDYLKTLGFEESWYEFNPTIARSFSYSTGPIWEVEIPGYSAGSVLGGERYDQLIERITGVAIPGTGFAIGFDRTLEAAELFGLIPGNKTATQVLVTVFSQQLQKQSLLLAKRLRDMGIKTELYTGSDEKMAKQFKYANKKGIPFAVILGETEVESNKIAIKNLVSGEQSLIAAEDINTIIQSK